jgi:hypothetical protein
MHTHVSGLPAARLEGIPFPGAAEKEQPRERMLACGGRAYPDAS